MNFLEKLNYEQLFELKTEVDYYFEIAKKNDTASIINEFSNMDKIELNTIINTYKKQLSSVKNNKEFEDLDKRIKIGISILNSDY